MILGTVVENVVEHTSFIMLKYPDTEHRLAERVPVTNYNHAQLILNLRTRKYIAEHLRGWAKQRQRALAHAHRVVPTRHLYAIDRIIQGTLWNYECSLPTLCSRVARMRDDIELISPNPGSRFYNHYLTVIVPIVDWCSEHSPLLKG